MLSSRFRTRVFTRSNTRAARSFLSLCLAALGVVNVTPRLLANTIPIPNGSFEAPPVPQEQPFAMPDMDAWQKSPQPIWYDPAQNYNTPWDYLMGTFFNVPNPGTYIDNCDGLQASFLFAVPQAAIFQDYDSVAGTNTTPTHAFNARYYPGSSYTLTVGAIGGVDGQPPLYIGATLELSLYYRDPNSNLVTVAATTITNDLSLFPTNTHFVDFSVQVPPVQVTDPWVGKHLGVRIASTVGFDKAGGYWDIDNVRLVETAVPLLLDPQRTPTSFKFTLRSEPDLRFEILAATNAALALSNWTSLGNVTNTAGTVEFTDPAPTAERRFYRARQLP